MEVGWILLPLLLLHASAQPHPANINNFLERQLKNWTDTFGTQIFDFANVATRYEEIRNRYEGSRSGTVKPVNLKSELEEMVKELDDALSAKVNAIRKIMIWAEERALEHFGDPDREPYRGSYLNARKINSQIVEPPPSQEEDKERDEAEERKMDPLVLEKVELKQDDHFGFPVNLNTSIVHVPSGIFDRREDILDGVHWTNRMDEVFKSNYAQNPTLFWQYFGSSLGFMRQYPAAKWPKDNTQRKEPDIFDCRRRPWYTGAANSPKNVVILQDVSGSMMGLRREIARHVVYTILDTLNENDYVNVLNFTEHTAPLVPCFRDTLVQANLENLREFKVALDQDRTKDMANFTEALKAAYTLLERHRESRKMDSANCNEAIMLITDGVPESFHEIFDPHNEEMLGRTRVFTYLVGREIAEKADILKIACSNKGYFTQITTLGEVENQVVKYLPVMSRPMVMADVHAVSWTNVYADVADIQESDWLWEEKTRSEQRSRSDRYKELLKKLKDETEKQEYIVSPEEEIAAGGGAEGDKEDKGKKKISYSARRAAEFLDYGVVNPTEEGLREMFAKRERINKENIAKWGMSTRKYRFMVSLSIPVFDRRNATEKLIVPDLSEQNLGVEVEGSNSMNQSFPDLVTIVQEKIANFLGVAGTDVPINEFQKIATPFKIGVNGYAFAITENGHVLFHPEWRPLFTDFLRPNYNSVDLSELELADSDKYERNFEENLMKLRKEMIHIESHEGVKTKTLQVRVPLEDFKRVTLRKQVYFFAKVPQTPYTLALTLPESQQFKYEGETEIRLAQDNNLTRFFDSPREPRRWRLNPDWTYCDFIRGDLPIYRRDKEGLFLHFLKEIQNANTSWQWKTTKPAIKMKHPPQEPDLSKPVYICDKSLVQSVVFDAEKLGIFTLKHRQENKQILRSLGALVGFYATRSGLTRWVDYREPSATRDEDGNETDPFATYMPFQHMDLRATDEVWYKRAVERYFVDKGLSYVLSVPFDAGLRDDAMVTATRAIFVHRRGTPNQAAPVAVAGVHFRQDKMAEKFFSITSKCVGGGCLKCKEELDCYLVDENGYVLVAGKAEYTGRFFGELHGDILESLVTDNIYKRVRVVDYQGMCFHLFSKSGFGMILQNPFKYMQYLLRWMIGRLAWIALQTNLHTFINADYAGALAEVVYVDEEYYEEQEKNPNWHPFFQILSINKTRLRPCHKEYSLYTYGPKYYTLASGYHPGILPNCDSQGHNGFYGIQKVNRTNLIMIAVDGKCSSLKGSRRGTEGQEVVYPREEEIDAAALQNDVLNQICRIPHVALDRKRPTARCLFFNEDEKELKEDCGGVAGLRSSLVALLVPIFGSLLLRV